MLFIQCSRRNWSKPSMVSWKKSRKIRSLAFGKKCLKGLAFKNKWIKKCNEPRFGFFCLIGWLVSLTQPALSLLKTAGSELQALGQQNFIQQIQMVFSSNRSACWKFGLENIFTEFGQAAFSSVKAIGLWSLQGPLPTANLLQRHMRFIQHPTHHR